MSMFPFCTSWNIKTVFEKGSNGLKWVNKNNDVIFVNSLPNRKSINQYVSAWYFSLLSDFGKKVPGYISEFTSLSHLTLN